MHISFKILLDFIYFLNKNMYTPILMKGSEYISNKCSKSIAYIKIDLNLIYIRLNASARQELL